MFNLNTLTDSEFWSWLCEIHGWELDCWAWIEEYCPQLPNEDYQSYIYRAMFTFNASEPADRELYYNLLHRIAVACDPYILSFSNTAHQAVENAHQIEQALYALGWSLEEIAEVCRRENAQMLYPVYQSWADAQVAKM